MNRLVFALALSLLVPPAFARDEDYERAPIHYSTAVPNDPIAHLKTRMEHGEAKLEWSPTYGYLPSLLKELNAPVSSQTLVFSRTSFQRDRISPKKPRALYFGDDAYVGWVKGGNVIEVAAVDAKLGVNFYSLDQSRTARP